MSRRSRFHGLPFRRRFFRKADHILPRFRQRGGSLGTSAIIRYSRIVSSGGGIGIRRHLSRRNRRRGRGCRHGPILRERRASLGRPLRIVRGTPPGFHPFSDQENFKKNRQD